MRSKLKFTGHTLKHGLLGTVTLRSGIFRGGLEVFEKHLHILQRPSPCLAAQKFFRIDVSPAVAGHMYLHSVLSGALAGFTHAVLPHDQRLMSRASLVKMGMPVKPRFPFLSTMHRNGGLRPLHYLQHGLLKRSRLLLERQHVLLPVLRFRKPRECHREGRVRPAAGEPGGVVDHPQRAQGFDEV